MNGTRSMPQRRQWFSRSLICTGTRKMWQAYNWFWRSNKTRTACSLIGLPKNLHSLGMWLISWTWYWQKVAKNQLFWEGVQEAFSGQFEAYDNMLLWMMRLLVTFTTLSLVKCSSWLEKAFGQYGKTWIPSKWPPLVILHCQKQCIQFLWFL